MTWLASSCRRNCRVQVKYHGRDQHGCSKSTAYSINIVQCTGLVFLFRFQIASQLSWVLFTCMYMITGYLRPFRMNSACFTGNCFSISILFCFEKADQVNQELFTSMYMRCWISTHREMSSARSTPTSLSLSIRECKALQLALSTHT